DQNAVRQESLQRVALQHRYAAGAVGGARWPHLARRQRELDRTAVPRHHRDAGRTRALGLAEPATAQPAAAAAAAQELASRPNGRARDTSGALGARATTAARGRSRVAGGRFGGERRP